MPRWALIFAVPAALVSLWIVGHAVGNVLVLFLVASVVALLLNPLVRLLRRAHLPRGLAVTLVYLFFVAAIGGAIYLVIDPARGQVEDIRRNLPSYIAQAEHHAADLQRWLAGHGIHVNLVRRVHDALPALERWFSRQSGHLLSYSLSVLKGVIEFIVVVVASIYMLLDAPRIARFAERLAPGGAGLLHKTERGLARYLRAQVLVSAIIGLSAGAAMWVYGLAGIFDLGSTYAVAFGLWAFSMEFIPYAGPVLGAVPPVVLAAFSQGALTAVWVIVAFVVIHQLEGHIVVPQIMGRSVGLHPLLVIFGLLLGGALLGVLGVLLAIPLAVMLRELTLFVWDRLELDRSPAPDPVPPAPRPRRLRKIDGPGHQPPPAIRRGSNKEDR